MRGCLSFGGRVAFRAGLHHLWVTATISRALKLLSTCPDPHVVPSRLHLAMVPSKPAQEPGGQSTSRDTPDTCGSPHGSGTPQPPAPHGFRRRRELLACFPMPSPLAWPGNPAPGSALSLSASAPEEGDMPDFFAKHHLNFVTSKAAAAAAALPGAVYIALRLLLPAQSCSPQARCPSRLPESVFCALAKLVAKLLLHSCHVAAARHALREDVARCFPSSQAGLAGPAPSAHEAFAGAADQLRPSQCTALLLQFASQSYK